jgi:hypothetical protein
MAIDTRTPDRRRGDRRDRPRSIQTASRRARFVSHRCPSCESFGDSGGIRRHSAEDCSSTNAAAMCVDGPWPDHASSGYDGGAVAPRETRQSDREFREGDEGAVARQVERRR